MQTPSRMARVRRSLAGALALALTLAALMAAPAPAAAQIGQPLKPLVAEPDLTITATVDSPLVNGGAPVGYTFTVRNVPVARPFVSVPTATATGVEVQVTLPAGFAFHFAYGTHGFNCSHSGAVPDVVTCLGGSIAAGDSATIRIAATAGGLSGTTGAYAVVDPANRIAERDESARSNSVYAVVCVTHCTLL